MYMYIFIHEAFTRWLDNLSCDFIHIYRFRNLSPGPKAHIKGDLVQTKTLNIGFLWDRNNLTGPNQHLLEAGHKYLGVGHLRRTCTMASTYNLHMDVCDKPVELPFWGYPCIPLCQCPCVCSMPLEHVSLLLQHELGDEACL